MENQRKIGPQWVLLLLLIALSTSHALGNYTLDKCYCYSDNYDNFLQGKISAFTNPPTPGPYEYIGVMPKANEVYNPCMCSDVTRVQTVLRVTESSVVTSAADSTKQIELNNNVTTKLNALIAAMNNTAALQNRLLSFTALYSSHNTSEALFDVEIRLRGRNETLKDAVSQSLQAQLANNILPGIGAVNISAMTFSVLKCATDPPAAPKNGNRNWTTGNVASSEAVYTCDDRYNMSSGRTRENITCSQTTLTWGALPTNLTCVPGNPKCLNNPPAAPQNAFSTWDNFSLTEGTIVSYSCKDGYEAKDNILAISTCKSGVWTTIASTFNCIQTGCLDSPPQIPVHGILTWSRQKANGTIALYSCTSGYKSITGQNPKIQCTNQTWVGFPEGWQCVNENTNLNLLNAKTGVGVYSDGDDEMKYIFYVTIPSICGLILFIMCCLCCTRIDSPLFNVCSAKGKLDAGYTKA